MAFPSDVQYVDFGSSLTYDGDRDGILMLQFADTEPVSISPAQSMDYVDEGDYKVFTVHASGRISCGSATVDVVANNAYYFIIKFNGNGGTVSEDTRVYIQGASTQFYCTFTPPTPPTRDGHTFKGWSTSRDGDITDKVWVKPRQKYSDAYADKANLYAIWEAEAGTVHTLDIVQGEHGTVATTHFETSDTITVDIAENSLKVNGTVVAVTPESDIYYFAGLGNLGQGHHVLTGDAVTLTAVFRELPLYSVTVSIPKGHATVSPVGADVRKGSSQTFTATVDDGYFIARWTALTGVYRTTYYGSSVTISPTGDTVLTLDIEEEYVRPREFRIAYSKTEIETDENYDSFATSTPDTVYKKNSLNTLATVVVSEPTSWKGENGYHFVFWRKEAHGEPIWAGQEIEISEGTTTLYPVFAVGDPSHVPTVPSATSDDGFEITVFKDWSGIWHRDLAGSDLVSSRPVIVQAENRGGSASFTVLNAYDTDDGIMSDGFEWETDTYISLPKRASRHGALDVGMPVAISVGENIVFRGVVSTLTVSGETVRVECADLNALLDKTGTVLRRNYRGEETSDYLDAHTDDDGNPYGLFTDTEATLVSYGWTVETEDKDETTSAYVRMAQLNGTAEGKTVLAWTFGTGDHDRLRGIRVRMRQYNGDSSSSRAGDCWFDVRLAVSASEGDYTLTWNDVKVEFSSISDSFAWLTVPLSSPVSVKENTTATLSLVLNSTQRKQNLCYLQACVHDKDGCAVTTLAEGAKSNTTMASRIDLGKTVINPNGTWSATAEGRVFRPSDTSTYTAEPSTGRFYVSYTSDTVSVSEIMSDMCSAVSMSPCAPSLALADRTDGNAGDVAMFRTGNGNIGDYMRRLSEIGDASLAFAMDCIGRVTVAKRWSRDDTAKAHIAYAGDNVVESVPFASISADRTVRHKPSLVTHIASISGIDGEMTVPVTLFRPDVFSRVESLTTGSASTLNEAVATALSELTTEELWTGSVTLPLSDTVRAMSFVDCSVSDGDGSMGGVPLMLTDSRIGLSEYPVKVYEARYDLNAMTVTLTLNGYSAEYSSDLADTIAQAVSKGSDSAVADTSLWSRQYYANTTVVQFSPCYVSAGDDMRVHTVGGRTVNATTTQWYQIGERWTVVGLFETKDDVSKYGVWAWSLGNGAMVAIPKPRRPDLKRGQALVVCATVRL